MKTINNYINMKHINTYILSKIKNETNILEKLRISTPKKKTEYTLFPTTYGELESMIKDEMKQNGNNCSLNHIDISKLAMLSYLFSTPVLKKFNGDISQWDVSNVRDMEGMFCGSSFNGDISHWEILNVEKMSGMFANSKFNNNSICNWDVSNVKYMSVMFASNKIFNQDISKWKIKPDCRTAEMFGGDCPIEEKYKPYKNGKRI